MNQTVCHDCGKAVAEIGDDDKRMVLHVVKKKQILDEEVVLPREVGAVEKLSELECLTVECKRVREQSVIVKRSQLHGPEFDDTGRAYDTDLLVSGTNLVDHDMAQKSLACSHMSTVGLRSSWKRSGTIWKRTHP